MSLFNAFSQGGFAALSQTLENIGNIVAPIVPNDNEDATHSENNNRGDGNVDDEEDMEDSFDNKVQNFFSQFRENAMHAQSNTNPHNEHERSHHAKSDGMLLDSEPPSPASSFVSVDLESPRSTDSKGTDCSLNRTHRNHSNSFSASAFGTLSSPELEKKVQQKYREQLEGEISSVEKKLRELQRTSAKRIQSLEAECEQWKQTAEVCKSGGFSTSDSSQSDLELAAKEDENNTLYDKISRLLQEIEEKELHIASLQESNTALNEELQECKRLRDQECGVYEEKATVISLELRALEQANVDVNSNNAELSDKLAQTALQIAQLQEELQIAHRTAHSESSSSSTGSSVIFSEEQQQLTLLTNQVRESNKEISLLEQKLIDLQCEQQQQQHDDSIEQHRSMVAKDILKEQEREWRWRRNAHNTNFRTPLLLHRMQSWNLSCNSPLRRMQRCRRGLSRT